jgi:hypothetical protein
VLHLEFVQIGVREDVAATTEDAIFLVILNGVAQQVVQFPCFINSCGHESSPYAGFVVKPFGIGSDSSCGEVGGLAREAAA